MTTDISIYLLRAKLTTRLPLSKPSEWKEVKRRQRKTSGDDLRCFIKQSPASSPKWTRWVGDVFDFQNAKPITRSAGGIVLLPSAGRNFAITFGTGWQGLAKEAIERDFGLIVALNQLRPEKLRHLVTKTIDLRSRERSTYHHSGAELDNFDLDVDVEWLRSAAGTATREDCSLVAGADALKLRSYGGELANVAELCSELLSIHAKDIPPIFDFAKNLRPIQPTAPEHGKLEDALIAALKARPMPDCTEIVLDSDLAIRMSNAHLFHGRQSACLADVTRQDLANAIDEIGKSGKEVNLRASCIHLTDADGQTVDTIPLVRAIQAELTLNDCRYIHLEGRWFSVSDNYIKQLDARVQALPDATSELQMPKWPSGASEEDYNKLAAAEKDWLCEDQNFLRPDTGAAVEPCDLLTAEWSFIHVKLGTRASAVHHQLGQLSGAASLLQRDPGTAAEMERRYRSKWGTGSLKGIQPRFVVAIGRRRKDTSLLGKMLLAKINILDQARRVRALGYGFAVARIDVVDQTSAAVSSTGRARKARRSAANVASRP